jgi:hypothetical protein
MNASVLKEIEELRSLTVNGLREEYRQVFGEDSRSGNKDYLYRRIAWRLQAKAEAWSSSATRRRWPRDAAGLFSLERISDLCANRILWASCRVNLEVVVVAIP